jgi:hypothetical protein
MLNNNMLAKTMVIMKARPPKIQPEIEYRMIRPDINANNPRNM